VHIHQIRVIRVPIFANMSQQLSPEQLEKIAKQFGTPVYVYHAERIKEQYDKLLIAFDGVDYKVFLCC
jgi:diaminopimelate decarboxylase